MIVRARKLTATTYNTLSTALVLFICTGRHSGSGAARNHMADPAAESVVLKEVIDPNYRPSAEEIAEYAAWLGMDLAADADLLWIARNGLLAPLPPAWKPCKAPDGDIYYFNFTTSDSEWDHPCDERFKALYRAEKAKKRALFETRATKRLLALGSSLSERLGADSAIPRELPVEVAESIARHLRELPHAVLLPAGGSSKRSGGTAAAARPLAEGVPPARPQRAGAGAGSGSGSEAGLCSRAAAPRQPVVPRLARSRQ